MKYPLPSYYQAVWKQFHPYKEVPKSLNEFIVAVIKWSRRFVSVNDTHKTAINRGIIILDNAYEDLIGLWRISEELNRVISKLYDEIRELRIAIGTKKRLYASLLTIEQVVADWRDIEAGLEKSPQEISLKSIKRETLAEEIPNYFDTARILESLKNQKHVN